MIKKACIVCGVPTANKAPRCDRHPVKRSPSSKATSRYAHKKERKKLLGQPCAICGLPIDPSDLHADHIVPVSSGGEYRGLQATHSECNLRKGSRMGS